MISRIGIKQANWILRNCEIKKIWILRNKKKSGFREINIFDNIYKIWILRKILRKWTAPRENQTTNYTCKIVFSTWRQNRCVVWSDEH